MPTQWSLGLRKGVNSSPPRANFPAQNFKEKHEKQPLSRQTCKLNWNFLRNLQKYFPKTKLIPKANARVVVLNSLRWPVFVVNSGDNTKLNCYTLPPMLHHSFFRNLPPSFEWSVGLRWSIGPRIARVWDMRPWRILRLFSLYHVWQNC